VFAAKGRPAQDPLIVHVTDVAAANPLVVDPPSGLAVLADRFWPGPLTVVLRRAAQVPDEVTAGLDTVAVRVPAHPVARALLAAAAIPVAAPSANLFSRPSPTRAEHVLQDLDGRIDMVVDGGPATVGVESTVLDLSGRRPVILRPGAVTREMLRAAIGDVALAAGAAASETTSMRSPGLLAKHYSPRAPLTLYAGDPGRVVARIAADARGALERGERVGILAADEDRAALPQAARIATVGASGDLVTVATRLYAALRELDAAHVDRILARGFGRDDGLGTAIADRLRRAAAGRVTAVE
jgi:L-threonylcarbamoyladenylate synthase